MFFFFIATAAELPSKLYWAQVIKMAFNSLSRHSDRQPDRVAEALGYFPSFFKLLADKSHADI